MPLDFGKFFQSKPDIEPPWNDNWKLEVLQFKFDEITQTFDYIVPHEYKMQLISVYVETLPDGGISGSQVQVECYDGNSRIYRLAGDLVTGTSLHKLTYQVWDTPIGRTLTSAQKLRQLPNEMYFRPGMRINFIIDFPLPNHTFKYITLTFKRWNLRGI